MRPGNTIRSSNSSGIVRSGCNVADDSRSDEFIFKGCFGGVKAAAIACDVSTVYISFSAALNRTASTLSDVPTEGLKVSPGSVIRKSEFRRTSTAADGAAADPVRPSSWKSVASRAARQNRVHPEAYRNPGQSLTPPPAKDRQRQSRRQQKYQQNAIISIARPRVAHGKPGIFPQQVR